MSTCLRLLLALVAIPLSIPLSARAEEPAGIRRVAFVVGANDGGRERVRLRYAETDARAFSQVIERLGGVAPGDRFLLVNPSKSQFTGGLDRVRQVLLQDNGARRVELFVYYSGHSDEQGLLLGEERVPYEELRKQIDTLPADVRIAILDSCASGAMTRRKGGTLRPPFMVDDSSKVQGHAILTSSAENEAAQESDRIGGSFFTHYLLSGLRGAADASHDGRVTLNEAYQFAFNETLARTEQTQSGAQHPAYDIQLSGTGDLVMTDLRGSSARLALAAELDGRLFVRNEMGQLSAELRKFPGRVVDLGLDAGTYDVTLVSGEQTYAARVSLREGGRTELSRLQLVGVQRELTARRGGTFVDPPLAIQTEPESAQTPVNQLPPAVPQPELVPPPPTPVIAPAMEYDRVLARISLVPGLNTTTTSARVLTNLSLNLIGSGDRVEGAELGLFNWLSDGFLGLQSGVAGNVALRDSGGVQGAAGFNLVRGDMWGAQGSSGFNLVFGRMRGVQASAGFNFTVGAMSGVQGSAAFNIVGGRDEAPGALHALVQGAAAFNFANENFVGVQGAGGFNIANGAVYGVQGAAGFNVANGDVGGVQGAAGFNFARNLIGAQIAVLNVAGDVTGAQVGIVNIAGRVKGVQAGLVNISEDISGVPLGLINWSKSGMLHLDAWFDSSAPFNVGLKMGSRHVYTLASVDGGPQQTPRAALGVGFQVPWRRFFLMADVTVGGYVVWREGQTGYTYGRPRVGLGFKLFEHLSLIGGVGAHVEGIEIRPLVPLPEGGWQVKGSETVVKTLPLVFGGLQF